MEDVLKGEGGNAIRAFYADCHLPFLQFFMLFQGRFTTVLKQMVAALDTLEPDPSGYIREQFLDVDIEQGLRHIAQLTGNLTDEANSIMKEVADIVSLPYLDDSEVQDGIRDATMKRNDTVTQLHEFDANQTTALTPIAQDLLTMETWISDIESMFQEGLTDIHFPADQWAALSSRNTLKTDLVQHTAAMAGIPVMMGMNGQPKTMLGALLAGQNPIRFGYGFVDRFSTLYGFSIVTLPGMATYARPITTEKPEIYTEDAELVALFEEMAKQPHSASPGNNNLIDPNTGDYMFTFEGKRRVLGGNGPGTIDGFAPYAMAGYEFYLEDISTMFSADATPVERLEAAAFTFLKPAKAYEIVHDIEKGTKKAEAVGKGTGKIDKTYTRPSGYRKGVRDEAWEKAKGADGEVRDPGIGNVMNKEEPWDMGHKPGYEFRKHQKSAQERGISRKQFLDEHNNSDHYRPELPSTNRSHKGEDLTDNYFGD